ncbi:MAG: response regulator transcription factor [Nitrospirales bacterium]|nr:response regulator transcription factor [Nitrospirales bacterium]
MVHIKEIEDRPSCLVVDFGAMVASRKSPGIIIVNGRDKIIHVNRSAWDVLTLLRDHGTVACDALMPTALLDLCHDVQARLREHRIDGDPVNLEETRLIATPNGRVLLRAVALEGGAKLTDDRRRVLVLLEHVAERSHMTAASKERFGLTNREWAVSQSLLKGYTNKEIGSALNISEPTVKAHINHIMQKMKCSTRTGIVSLVMTSCSGK